MNKKQNIIPEETKKIVKELKPDKSAINIDLSKLNEILNYNKEIGELNADIFDLFPSIKIFVYYIK